MSIVSIDLAAGVSRFVTEWRVAEHAKAWARLLFSMLFSALISFLGVCGVMLVDDSTLLVAIGSGMIAAAVALLGLFTASPLTRQMAISIPQSVVKKLHEGGQATILRK